MKENETKAKPEVKEAKPAETQPVEAVAVTHRRIPRKTLIGMIIAAVVICFAAGLAGAKLYNMVVTDPSITGHQNVANDGNKPVTQEETEIASVVEKVSPSVVSIVTTSRTISPYYGTREEDSAGTGIIISKDGYVLTNKHVIDGASTVQVVTSDGTTYENVKVLGSDPLNDVAFLKIPDVSNLRAAELGDSSSIRVGQKVVAIGNSLGQYQNTVTSGIISGTGRPISAQSGDNVENLTDLIQTDAAINPGNSGGPLLNLAGQVIGINTAIIQDAQGIGFSIPINATKGALKGVLAGKGVHRAYLGVNYISITAEVAKHYDLSVKKGAYVFNGNDKDAVVSGSPADKAGLKNKDIITKVGGIEVGTKGDVSSLVAEYAPGDTIQLSVLRDGKTMTMNVTLSDYKAS
ncbi:MAG TPA: trypsin-like peptidase domain-containing protein [Candidatus Saccharimonadales bacterium]|nr:trypsin-like peptidase domain-containing protein [Candidatus Saccharimonadales bacterium]